MTLSCYCAGAITIVFLGKCKLCSLKTGYKVTGAAFRKPLTTNYHAINEHFIPLNELHYYNSGAYFSGMTLNFQQ